MPTFHSALVCSLCLLLAIPCLATAAARGYVEIPFTPSTCIQETHVLTDPCSGSETLLDDSRGIDLDPYLCTHVVVDGPDVGIECPIIAPFSVVPVQTSCPIAFSGLWLAEGEPAQINWAHITCAKSYDVIRGELGALSDAGSFIDLGDVRCLGEDIPDPHYYYVAGPVDPEQPQPGQAYFYLARAAGLPFGDETYGRSSDGRERVPALGDCRF